MQWSIEKVEICTDFPLGVKTMYRAYSCDEVNEIVLDSSKHFGYSCQKVNVQWFPAATQSTPSGMYLLQRFPMGEIKPCKFVENSRAILDHVLKVVQNHYTPSSRRAVPKTVANQCHGDAVVADWIDFAENVAPQSDIVDDYCEQVPLHVPFFNELFSGETEKFHCAQIPKKINAVVTETNALDSVIWSRRGVSRSKKHPAMIASRGHNLNSASSDDDSGNSSDDSECEYEYRKLSKNETLKQNALSCGQIFHRY